MRAKTLNLKCHAFREARNLAGLHMGCYFGQNMAAVVILHPPEITKLSLLLSKAFSCIKVFTASLVYK